MCNLKDTRDCRAVSGEDIARQHWMVVFRMNLEIKERK